MATNAALTNPRQSDLPPVPAMAAEGCSRLEPVAKPTDFGTRMAYWWSRKEFGKVMTPIRVVCARMPGSMKALGGMLKFNNKGIQMNEELQLLIGNLTSQINGCSSCIDLARMAAVRGHRDLAKIDAVMDYRTNVKFSERERAALAYVEEASRNKGVSDTTFAILRRHFSEREIVEITWVNAFQNFFNLLNRPLGIGSDGFCAIAQAKASSQRS
jgi:alkylhydroperoxidase family enzyme